MKLEAIVICLCVQLSVLTAYGQNTRPEKRIYLVDVTASMIGKGIVETSDKFDKMKGELIDAIESIDDPTTEVVIIPFTNIPHVNDVKRGTADDKDSLKDYIREMTVKPGDTNIADAWSLGVQEVDSTRINYFFLLTDGLHNCGPEIDVLYERLGAWEEFARGNYYFAFYVMLVDEADNPKICEVADRTRQMWVIKSMDINVTFINFGLEINANIKNRKDVTAQFSTNNSRILPEDFDFHFVLDENPYYGIKKFKASPSGRNASFTVVEKKPLMELPIEMSLEFHAMYDMEKYYWIFFTPEDIVFNIRNSDIREMTIKAKRR